MVRPAVCPPNGPGVVKGLARKAEFLSPYLVDRLCAAPISSTVRGSLPVLFFGEPFTAPVATIGINPSKQEYLSPQGLELQGARRRFETLSSLGAVSRSSLTEQQIHKAIDGMRAYFDRDETVYGWFGNLSRVVEGMGLSFRDRAVCHLDLVQEATDPVWSVFEKMNPQEADAVLRRDLPFLTRQLEDFPFQAVVCTSARVFAEVSTTARVQIKFTGKMERLTWYVGEIHLNRGSVGLAAWNIPLKRATGLKAKDEPAFGGVLRRHFELLGTKLN